MKLSPVIEQAVENIIKNTGIVGFAFSEYGTSEEIDEHLNGIREYLRIQLCKVAHASSLDANVAQHCAAYTIKH